MIAKGYATFITRRQRSKKSNEAEMDQINEEE
jgi:hypothetical protein